MISIEIQKGDISLCDVDAIVNSVNNELILGSDISGILKRVGGQSIQDECNAIGSLKLGEAVLADGGSLKAKHIIHASCFPLGSWANVLSVRNAMRHTLKIINEHNMKRVAFSPMGTGAGAFAMNRSARIMFDELHTVLTKETSTLETVYFIVTEDKELEIFCDEVKTIEHYFENIADISGYPTTRLPQTYPDFSKPTDQSKTTEPKQHTQSKSKKVK